jgi:hypothetical protein
MMAETFGRVREGSRTEWQFLMASRTLEYLSYSIVPPPFNVFYVLFLACRRAVANLNSNDRCGVFNVNSLRTCLANVWTDMLQFQSGVSTTRTPPFSIPDYATWERKAATGRTLVLAQIVKMKAMKAVYQGSCHPQLAVLHNDPMSSPCESENPASTTPPNPWDANNLRSPRLQYSPVHSNQPAPLVQVQPLLTTPQCLMNRFIWTFCGCC